MNHLFALLFITLCLSLPLQLVAAPPPVVIGESSPALPIGNHSSYLQEQQGELTLEQAMTAYRRSEFRENRSAVPNFGIGAAPVWLHVEIDNPGKAPLMRQLSIETAWLDQLDVYILHSGAVTAHYLLGDRHPFAQRPVNNRYFVIDYPFASGTSELLLRVQTPDPMVLPLYLLPPEQASARTRLEDYSYGFLYGFLLALLAYNMMLYAGLRDARYLLYSLYLALFITMNLSYTGHGTQLLWPDSAVWAQWSNPVLMVLYGSSGLIFALHFLQVRSHSPRLFRGVIGYVACGTLLLLLAILLGDQRAALLVSFSYVFLFTLLMLALGIVSLRSDQRPARYFLLAAIAALIGAATTALAVWGMIPTTLWTYRAVDIGMTLEATLLALALTYQFRLSQLQKAQAEQLARLDPLTNLNNRRAFATLSIPIWNLTQRHSKALCVILFDIDNFKQINDRFGHACGDGVLTTTARQLTESLRSQDIAARWGGEEFILLLPETTLKEAIALAERLRTTLAKLQVECGNDTITFTASFGVAERDKRHLSLEAIISAADSYLYQAKASGRNCVSHPETESSTNP